MPYQFSSLSSNVNKRITLKEFIVYIVSQSLKILGAVLLYVVFKQLYFLKVLK